MAGSTHGTRACPGDTVDAHASLLPPIKLHLYSAHTAPTPEPNGNASILKKGKNARRSMSAGSQNMVDHIVALRRQLDDLSAALGALALAQDKHETGNATNRAADTKEAPPPYPALPAFSAASPYKAPPGRLVAGSICTLGGGAQDTGHLTVSQLLVVLHNVPRDATVTMGASLVPLILRVHPQCHLASDAHNRRQSIYGVAATTATPIEYARAYESCIFFNALELGPLPVSAGALIDELKPYARDAPGAIVLSRRAWPRYCPFSARERPSCP
nr:hypothetical protein [Pandoravirus massiliensis]